MYLEADIMLGSIFGINNEDIRIIEQEPMQANILTYNGREQNPSWLNYDISKMMIVEQRTQKDAGSYITKFKPIKPYVWSDGTTIAKSFSWSINPVAILDPVITNTTFTFNGTAQGPTVSYDSIITQNGDSSSNVFLIDHLSEVAAGTYTTVWTIKSNNYRWLINSPKTFVWTIKKKTIEIPSVHNIAFTFNGEEQGPNITPSSDRWWTATNNVAIDADLYNLTISLADPINTVWSDGTTEDKITPWSIQTLVLAKPYSDQLSFIFNGEEQGPDIKNVPSSKFVNVTGDITRVTTGTYSVVYRLKNNNHINMVWNDETTENVTITFVIGTLKIPVPSLVTTSVPYNAAEQTFPAVTYESSYLKFFTVKGETAKTNVGKYNVLYDINPVYNATKDNVLWTDNTKEQKLLVWSITPKYVTKPSLSVTEFTFSAININILNYERNFNGTFMTRTGNATGFDMGNYAVSYSLKGNTDNVTNVLWTDGTTDDITLSWKINKKQLGIPAQLGVLYYNAQEQRVTWNSEYDNIMMDVSGNTGTNAKTYTATFTSKYPYNAQFGTTNSVSVTWNIDTLILAKPDIIDNTLAYDGKPKTVTIANENLTFMARTGTVMETERGSYTATYSLRGNTTTITNVKWVDNSLANVTLTWRII